MNWKISKIEISSFKAFKHVNLDLNKSGIVTLDGPNGYGKTSMFDAIELLLTGEISRVKHLFSILLTKNKKIYRDNLFWNDRSGNKELYIKIEFTQEDRLLILARHCPLEKLLQPSNNRADNYDHFQLYELTNFDSLDFVTANERDNKYIEEQFGENFIENFSFLNYLEQGQNRLLHTKVDDRKDKLGSLFSNIDLDNYIKNCQTLKTELTKFINNPIRNEQKFSFDNEIRTIRNLLNGQQSNVGYKKISNSDFEPLWDRQILFMPYDEAQHAQFNQEIQKLIQLADVMPTIKIRYDNYKIDQWLANNKESLKYLAKLGNDLGKLEKLEEIKQQLDELSVLKSIIKLGAANLQLNDLLRLKNTLKIDIETFEAQIELRNNYRRNSTDKERIITELNELKTKLLNQHKHINHNDSLCPLCGADWNNNALMMDAIELHNKNISSILRQDAISLDKLIEAMNNQLNIIGSKIESTFDLLNPQFNNNLYDTLKKIKTQTPIIIKLSEDLNRMQIVFDYTFTDNEEIIDNRYASIVKAIEGFKKIEDSYSHLPQDWLLTISNSFKNIEDFYQVKIEDLHNKLLYISRLANEAQNKRLIELNDNLIALDKENKAAKSAKEKVDKLLEILRDVKNNYTEKTIGSIELLFHIYSGRLIQNYQLGLGLFIESNEGKELKISTAEKSEHDALMYMSSGQISAISLAFFLSLNKVYSTSPLILIDDPTQSLDEINIASLTDLLRSELKDKQLILSTHEEDISAYMRYRFEKAGLMTKSINMQLISRNDT